jgi:hypothetical protein
LNIAVDKLIQPGIQYNGEEICGDKPVLLQLTNVDNRSTVKWYDAQGNEMAGQNGLSLPVLKAGEYYAEVLKSTCSLSSPSVKVNAIVDSLFVPNVFTANNDAFNDYFEILSQGIDNFQITLLNRYGQVVFETADPPLSGPPTMYRPVFTIGKSITRLALMLARKQKAG